MGSDSARSRPSLSEILNHLGEDRGRHFGAISPPIYQTSAFAFPDLASFRAAFRDERGQHLYTRGNNPTTEVLRKKLAALEGGEDALVTGSGVTPMALAALTFLAAGDHAVCVARPYAWTRMLFQRLLPRFGVACQFADLRDPGELATCLRPNTRLIALESPNSWTFEQQDLAAIAAIARARGIVTVLDNTWASPLGQPALDLGIDLVVHSLTKYVGGHADVVAGALIGSRALLDQVFAGPYMTIGPLLSPHDAWLLIRSLRTLPVRLSRIAESTRRILAFAEAEPRIRRVLAPAATGYPQAELSERQLRWHNGLLTLDLASDDPARITACVDRLQHFLLAVSWGGHESLAFPALALANEQGRVPAGLQASYLRLSIGLEEPEWLIADLRQALDALD